MNRIVNGIISMSGNNEGSLIFTNIVLTLISRLNFFRFRGITFSDSTKLLRCVTGEGEY